MRIRDRVGSQKLCELGHLLFLKRFCGKGVDGCRHSVAPLVFPGFSHTLLTIFFIPKLLSKYSPFVFRMVESCPWLLFVEIDEMVLENFMLVISPPRVNFFMVQ